MNLDWTEKLERWYSGRKMVAHSPLSLKRSSEGGGFITALLLRGEPLSPRTGWRSMVVGHSGYAQMLMRAHGRMGEWHFCTEITLNVTVPGGKCVWASGGLIITYSSPQLRPQILPLSSPCPSQSQASGGKQRDGGGRRWRTEMWDGGGGGHLGMDGVNSSLSNESGLFLMMERMPTGAAFRHAASLGSIW